MRGGKEIAFASCRRPEEEARSAGRLQTAMTSQPGAGCFALQLLKSGKPRLRGDGGQAHRIQHGEHEEIEGPFPTIAIDKMPHVDQNKPDKEFHFIAVGIFFKARKANRYDYDRFLCCACFSLRSSGPTATTPRWELRFSAGEDTNGWPGHSCPGAIQASPPSEAGREPRKHWLLERRANRLFSAPCRYRLPLRGSFFLEKQLRTLLFRGGLLFTRFRIGNRDVTPVLALLRFLCTVLFPIHCGFLS